MQLLKLPPGKVLCVIGASGGTGTFAVQLAKSVYGLKVSCTAAPPHGCSAPRAQVVGVSSAKNHAHLKALGCDVTIDRAAPLLARENEPIGRLTDSNCRADKNDVVAELRKAFPDGVDGVYDCFGGPLLSRADEMISKDGGGVVSIAGRPEGQFKNTKVSVRRRRSRAAVMLVCRSERRSGSSPSS